METRHQFVWRFQVPAAAVQITSQVDGRRRPARTTESSVFVGKSGAWSRALTHAVGVWLKWSIRLIVVSPLLVLAAKWIGAIAVVPFVLSVVSAALAFNLYFVFAAIRHLRERSHVRQFPFGRRGADRLGLFRDHESAVVGKVALLTPASDTMVWREVWTRGGVRPRRAAEGDDFAIIPDDGSAPIVVRLEAPPILLGTPETDVGASALTASLRHVGGLTDERVYALTLREGTSVALFLDVSTEVPRLDHIELGGTIRRLGSRPDSPYRGSVQARGRLARSTESAPLRIRVL